MDGTIVMYGVIDSQVDITNKDRKRDRQINILTTVVDRKFDE